MSMKDDDNMIIVFIRRVVSSPDGNPLVCSAYIERGVLNFFLKRVEFIHCLLRQGKEENCLQILSNNDVVY
jgi:hypothetical protein